MKHLLTLLLIWLPAQPIVASPSVDWVPVCLGPATPCAIAGGGVIIWSSQQGGVTGVIRAPGVARVSIVQRNNRYFLSNTARFSLLEVHLHVLQDPHSQLLIEYTDGAVVKQPMAGWGQALRVLSSSAAAPSPPALEHHAIAEQRQHIQAPRTVPATKPQAEFAIRAQGGVTIFSPTGR